MKAGHLVAFLLIALLVLSAGMIVQRQARPAAAKSRSVAAPGPDFVVAHAHPFAPRLIAFGQVEPVTLLRIAAAEAGTLDGLSVRPGAQVQAGETLAHLSGPAIAALLAQGQADLRSAQAQRNAAVNLLAIEQQQLRTHMVTRQVIQQAESAAAQSLSSLKNAESKLGAVRQMMTLTAPTSGTVLTLSSADGTLMGAGQIVLTLQPAGGLWLRAMVYGAGLAAIRIGMRGTFIPAGGSPAIPVHVVAIPGVISPGGGESIALEASGPPSAWLSGEAGAVVLHLASRPMFEVPTRALIVSQGKWWVLVHTAHGDQPRPVIPGPSEGWNTWIKSGLASGDKVVVNNAYLLFHAGIASQFQLPD